MMAEVRVMSWRRSSTKTINTIFKPMPPHLELSLMSIINMAVTRIARWLADNCEAVSIKLGWYAMMGDVA